MVAAPVTVKFGLVMPSITSVTVSVPPMTVSSLPAPLVLPPNTAGSLSGLIVTVTVAVSVSPFASVNV